jgi:hypothetical protein
MSEKTTIGPTESGTLSTKKTLSMDEIVTDRTMGRRATMGLIGAGVAGAAVAAVGMASAASAQESAQPQCSDSDPYDPGGYGRHCGGGCYPCRGVSDSDPRDPGGCGCRSCSDSDPSDPGGAGRHC